MHSSSSLKDKKKNIKLVKKMGGKRILMMASKSSSKVAVRIECAVRRAVVKRNKC